MDFHAHAVFHAGPDVEHSKGTAIPRPAERPRLVDAQTIIRVRVKWNAAEMPEKASFLESVVRAAAIDLKGASRGHRRRCWCAHFLLAVRAVAARRTLALIVARQTILVCMQRGSVPSHRSNSRGPGIGEEAPHIGVGATYTPKPK